MDGPNEAQDEAGPVILPREYTGSDRDEYTDGYSQGFADHQEGYERAPEEDGWDAAGEEEDP